MGRGRQREETGRPERTGRRKRCSEKERRQEVRREPTAGGAPQPEEREEPGGS